MPYRLGVDVGGTFTDLLLIDESSGKTFRAKVPSTPSDSSIGVLNGIERVCSDAGVDSSNITHVMHGTTVATVAPSADRGASKLTPRESINFMQATTSVTSRPMCAAICAGVASWPTALRAF